MAFPLPQPGPRDPGSRHNRNFVLQSSRHALALLAGSRQYNSQLFILQLRFVVDQNNNADFLVWFVTVYDSSVGTVSFHLDRLLAAPLIRLRRLRMLRFATLLIAVACRGSMLQTSKQVAGLSVPLSLAER